MKPLTKLQLTVLIVVLAAISTINVTDKELLAPVAVAVRADLGLSDTQLGTIRSAVFIAAMIGNILWGILSDRWVRKYIIAIGTVLWSGITWMTSFSQNYSQLLLARASMSFSEGCFNPSAYPLAADSIPKRLHGLALGILSLTYPIGTATALIVAGLIGTSRWRQPFVIFGIIGIGLGLLVILAIKEPVRGASEETIQEAGGGYSGKFSFTEFKRVLSIRSTLLVYGLDAAQASINWSIAFWAPLYLARYKIASNPEQAAIALLPAITGYVMGALLGGAIIDRLHHRTVRGPAIVSFAAMVGGLFISLIVFNIVGLPAFMAASFFLGIVSYMVMPAVPIIMFSVVSPETKAAAISASNVILNLIIAVVSFMIGYASDATHELKWGLGGTVIIMFIIGSIFSILLIFTLPDDVARKKELIISKTIMTEGGGI